MRGKPNKQPNIFPILTAFIAPAIVFAIHLFAINFYFYSLIPNLDIPMHFIGGMAIAVTVICLMNVVEKEKLAAFKSHFVRAVLLIALVSMSASFWEISEFIVDTSWGFNLQYSLQDTMKDMILGLIGGSIVVISWAYGKTQR